MPTRQSGVVKGPNQGEFSTDKRANGFMPLSGGASPVMPTNLSRFMHGDPGGSANLARLDSPVMPANPKFADGDPGYSDPNLPFPTEPGTGAVPVNPFLVSGSIVPASVLRDSAKK